MVICIGEILVDFIAKKTVGKTAYYRHAGGAPFNVACGIARFGGDVTFVGNVGADSCGDFLIEFAKQEKFRELLITRDPEHNTTIVFVDIDEAGERSFSFHRKNTADYRIPEKSLEKIKEADIVHFGSLMLSEKEGLELADKILDLSRKHAKKVSFDVNFRADIFRDEEEAMDIFRRYSQQADIIKYSYDELCLFSGIKDYSNALKSIAKEGQMVFLTLGKEGSVFYRDGEQIHVPSIEVKTVDTTGAGDAFFAGVLANLDSLFKGEALDIKEILRFGNIAGALVTTAYGALTSFPSLEEIKAYLK